MTRLTIACLNLIDIEVRARGQNSSVYAMTKRTNNDLQNITQTTKDRPTRTLLKTRGKLRCSHVNNVRMLR
jgi:hypothetical protein